MGGASDVAGTSVHVGLVSVTHPGRMDHSREQR